MKKFNRSIQIEIEVDSIATQFMDCMKDDFKHKEIVAEQLIGRMLTTDERALTKLYNALNGYTGEINFKVGDVVKVKDMTAYGYWTPESIEKGNAVTETLAYVTVLEVNPYADDTLVVTYDVPDKTGKMITRTMGVHHTSCEYYVPTLT